MQNIDLLIEKFLARTISPEERKILKKWVLRNGKNLTFFKEEIQKRSKNSLYHHFDEKEAFKDFVTTIGKSKSKKRFSTKILRYAAIVIGIISVGVTAYQVVFIPKSEIKIVENENSLKIKLDKVIITLADGTQQFFAQNEGNPLIDKDGNIIAKNQSQGLDFSRFDREKASNPIFNEIYVPYGQTFTLTLSDGTRVWLNAGTRMKFPQNLNSTTQNRIVYLDGEAYFDVTKDSERPFIVNAQNLDIRVLGTQFNVSAYEADGKIATTLVEGAVNVYEHSNPDTKILLKPSYQASFIKETGDITQRKVDTRMYTGWMENKLIIDNLSFKEILDKLERAHNVSFINKASYLNTEKFQGEFENENINTILETISSSTPFNYKIEKNVITLYK
ncbi:MAG: FecR domain-containing protein [Bacteroidota bacterium]